MNIHHIFLVAHKIVPRLQNLAHVAEVLATEGQGADVIYPTLAQLQTAYAKWLEKFQPFRIANCPLDLSDPYVHAKIEVFFNNAASTKMFYLTWYVGELINGDNHDFPQPPPADALEWGAVADFILETKLPLIPVDEETPGT